jgi:hypothetical protein
VNKLKGNRRIWWLVGIAVTILGVVAALVVLPALSPTPGTGGADVHVPKMQNVPPEGAPSMHLDTTEKKD